MRKITFLALIITAISCTTFNACKKDSTLTTPDYSKLALGKWMWYKTITTGSQSKPLDTFYNSGMFKEFLPNGTVITTDAGPNTTTEKYFFVSNKLGQTYNGGKDTSYSQILSFDAGAFSIYDRVVYNNVTPPAVVEYWHYFIK